MGQVIAINQRRFFTLEEAQELLPVVRRVTRLAVERAKFLSTQLSVVQNPEKKQALEEDVYLVFKEWHEKVKKLGADAKGMWLVDFDTGRGYYCWKYPEKEVCHYHGYEEGFRGRVKIH